MKFNYKLNLTESNESMINHLLSQKNYSANIVIKKKTNSKFQLFLAEKIESSKKKILKYLNSNKKDRLNNFFNEIEGAYVYIEMSNKKILIFNDFFSRIEIYYNYHDKSRILKISNVFSNLYNDKDILNHKGILHYFINYGSRTPKKETIFKSINRLDNSQYLFFNKIKNKVDKKYFEYKKIFTVSKQNNFDNVFLDSLKKKSSPDLNIVYLSSGWDSTAVLAGLVYLYGKKKVKAVTSVAKHDNRAGVHNKFEVLRAKKIANFFDIDHYLFNTDLSKKNIFTKIYNAFEFTSKNHLFGIVPISHYLIANFVKKKFGEGVTAFSGEYSDGLTNLGFSQNLSIFHKNSFGFREYSDKMRTYLYTSTFLKSISDGSYSKDPIFVIFSKYFDNLNMKSKKFKNKKDISKIILQNLFLNPSRMPFSQFKNNKSINKSALKHYVNHMSKEYLERFENIFNFENPFISYLQLYKSFHWQCSTVAGIELAGSANNINNQIAFQDRNLFDYFVFMPESLGRNLEINNTKFPIKKFLFEKINFPPSIGAGPHSYTYDVDPSFSILSQLINFSGLKNNFKKNLKEINIESLLDGRLYNKKNLKMIKKSYLNKNIIVGEELDILSKLIELSNFLSVIKK